MTKIESITDAKNQTKRNVKIDVDQHGLTVEIDGTETVIVFDLSNDTLTLFSGTNEEVRNVLATIKLQPAYLPKIAQTDLEITKVIYQESRTSLFREERAENAYLFAVKNTENGEIGHLYYELEVDKRDIEHEELYTDNPALMTKVPESWVWQDLSSVSIPPDVRRDRNDEIEDLIQACLENQVDMA